MKYAVAFGAISAHLRHFEHLHHTQEIHKGHDALLYGCALSLYLIFSVSGVTLESTHR